MSSASRSTWSLYSLPDDILRRIIDTVGRDLQGHMSTSHPQVVLHPHPHAPSALKTAHILAAVSSRLRSYVIHSYLPSVTVLSHRDLAPLVRHDNVTEAAAALVALLRRTVNLKIFASEGTKAGLITSLAVSAMTDAAAKSLESVDIKYIDISNEAVRPLFHCPNLKCLELAFGRHLTPDLFDFGPGRTISAPLEVLDLTWLDCIGIDAVRHIAQIRTLKTLLLKNCERFDNEAAKILAVGPAANNIHVLSVSYCPISNASLHMLLRSMPNLTHVSVAERSGHHAVDGAYTQVGIDEAKSLFPHVAVAYDT